MKKVTLIIVITAILSTICFAENDPNSLKGLKGVAVEVRLIGGDSMRYGLRQTEIGVIAAKIIQKSKIEFIPADDANEVKGNPVLCITVNSFIREQDDMCAVFCQVALKQDTKLMRDNTIITKQSITWSNEGIAMLKPGLLLPAIHGKVEEYTKQFINEYNLANQIETPKKEAEKQKIETKEI